MLEVLCISYKLDQVIMMVTRGYINETNVGSFCLSGMVDNKLLHREAYLGGGIMLPSKKYDKSQKCTKNTFSKGVSLFVRRSKWAEFPFRKS